MRFRPHLRKLPPLLRRGVQKNLGSEEVDKAALAGKATFLTQLGVTVLFAVFPEAGFGFGSLNGVAQDGFDSGIGGYKARVLDLHPGQLGFGERLLRVVLDAHVLWCAAGYLGDIFPLFPLAVVFGAFF